MTMELLRLRKEDRCCLYSFLTILVIIIFIYLFIYCTLYMFTFSPVTSGRKAPLFDLHEIIATVLIYKVKDYHLNQHLPRLTRQLSSS